MARFSPFERDVPRRVCLMLVGCGALLAPLRAAQDVVLRRFLVLPQALPVTVEGQAAEARSLIVEWRASDAGGAQRADRVRIGGIDDVAPRACRLVEADGRVTGELSIAKTPRWPAATWHFSAPLDPSESVGRFENGETAGNAPPNGRARLFSVYDAGKAPGIRAWVPPGAARVRGLFIWGNAGALDDRDEVTRDSWLAFCRLHRFALVATSGYNADMTSMLLAQIDQVARRTGHAELNDAPVIFTGHSNGGMKAWEFTASHPERVVAFTVSKAAWLTASEFDAAGRAVPAILVAGEYNDRRYNEAIRILFARNRGQHAPWAFMVEARVGHERGKAPRLWLPFFHWAVQARVPESPPTSGPVALRPIVLSNGWVVVHGFLKPGAPRFGRAGEMKASRALTSWLPDEISVYADLGLSARKRLSLRTESDRAAYFRGETVRLQVGDFGPRSGQEAWVLVNGRVAGRVTPESPVLALPSGGPGVYLATVVGTSADPSPPRIGEPISWVVEPR